MHEVLNRKLYYRVLDVAYKYCLEDAPSLTSSSNTSAFTTPVFTSIPTIVLETQKYQHAGLWIF